MKIAAVVPVLNESMRLRSCLGALLALADSVVVADGGSSDDSVASARGLGANVIRSERGRATQMNAGAAGCADADVLVFVHADVTMPLNWREVLEKAVNAGASWGRFDVRLDAPRPLLRVVEALMNWRSRWTGIATGDQVIFLTRSVWERCGGWPAVELMEDIRLSAQLLRLGFKPACLRERVTVSARRWERDGIIRTIALMWGLRAMHALGVSPVRLHRWYYGKS